MWQRLNKEALGLLAVEGAVSIELAVGFFFFNLMLEHSLASQTFADPLPLRGGGEGKGLDKCYSTFRSSGI